MPIIKPSQFNKDLLPLPVFDKASEPLTKETLSLCEEEFIREQLKEEPEHLQAYEDPEKQIAEMVEKDEEELNSTPDYDSEGHLTQAGAMRQLSSKTHACIIGPAGTGK